MLGTEQKSRRLDSWKEIAEYLRRDKRTAIRWERQKNLPVHRVPGGKRKAVFAYTRELDEWLSRDEPGGPVNSDEGGLNGNGIADSEIHTANTEVSSDVAVEKASHHQTKMVGVHRWPGLFKELRSYSTLWYAGAIVLVILLVFAVRSFFVTAHASNAPVRLGFTNNAVQAFDSQGRALWTHTFGSSLDPGALAKPDMSYAARIGDFRGDGETEVLLAAPLRPKFNAPEPDRLEIDLFSAEGKLLWSYVPDRKFQFGSYHIGAPWAFGDIFVSSRGHKPVIWAAFINSVWGNSYVVNLDPETGIDTLRFVNTGSLRALYEVAQGGKVFLLAGGFNNEPDSSSLAIIDESRPFAASPQTKGDRHECRDCPPGVPDYYFVFPRSEVNEVDGLHEDAVSQIQSSGSQLEMVKTETQGFEDEGRVHYLLQTREGFRVASVRFNSGYDTIHRIYEREGKLRHSLQTCPERLHPRPIKMWTPSAGWTELQLPPRTFNQ